MLKQFIVLSVIMLTGCTAIQQKQLAEEFAKDKAEHERYCKHLWQTNRKLDLIRDKLPLYAQDATLEQRASRARSSENLKPAISAYDQVISLCQTKITEKAGKYESAYVMEAYSKYQERGRDLRMKLWNGDISFGDFITNETESYNQFIADRSAHIEYARQQSIATQDQINANAWGNALSAAARSIQNTTNANSIPRSVVCTSTNAGYSVQTTCY